MKIIGIIILTIIIWWTISSIINSIKRKRYEEEILKKLGPFLEKGLSELDVADITNLKERLKAMKDFFEKNKIVLKDENDEPINICPRCGDTLTVKTVNWHGRIFGCPNYPKCHYLKKVKDIKEGTFYNLHF